MGVGDWVKQTTKALRHKEKNNLRGLVSLWLILKTDR